MHIAMFSINPLFPDLVMGGAPKHLKNIAIHMGKLGHQVTVLCTKVVGSEHTFKWQNNVTVYPVLGFKQPFPQPYAIPAYEMANALQAMGDVLANADRFYMHDGEFLFPYAYQHIPTVISLRDNVYPETLLGGFLFQGDSLILISEYSRQHFLKSVGRFFPQLGERITVIHNGLDWDKFKPTTPNKILDIIPIDPNKHPILLHPHRPEDSKGIRQTIQVVDLLVKQHGITELIALAPKWLAQQATPELREFYAEIEADIQARGLQNNFIFHEWIPHNLMPEYYSLADVTLSMGNFVESFGNAVYESLGCGTPTIAARISTHRELLPENLLDKVDWGDVETTAKIASEIIRTKRQPSVETLAYLQEYYAIDRQLNAYAEVILNAEIREPIVYQHPQINEATQYQLAPWCYISSTRGIYHDFEAIYLNSASLVRLINAYPDGFARKIAESFNISMSEFERFVGRGYLVPIV